MKPDQDSKPSKVKESTPSTKDAADGDKVPSTSTPPKNDKKSKIEQLHGTDEVKSLSTPRNKDQKSSNELLRKGDDKAPSAPPNKDQKPPSHELLRGGDDIASSDKVVSSPTIQPEKGLNEGKERSTALLPKVVSSEKGREGSSVPLRGKDDTSTHTHTASNKDTKGSDKKPLAGFLRGDGSIIDKSQPMDNERTGQDK